MCVLLGAASGGGVALIGAPELFFFVTWDVAVSLVLAWAWQISWSQDHEGTKRIAEEEGGTHTTDTGILIAAVASLAAVVTALLRSGSDQDPVAVIAVILSLVTVALSWALTNTVFALKYARLYYVEVDGGIDFRQEQPPSYSDFAYTAFTVGMAYGVSDNVLASTRIRKVAFGHALLSYLFGTVVIAVSVGLIAGLGQR
ncbi:DUF1345 domain-containing protein [Streptosporangium sp. KLBMP 9127]|nr:DUF1345 domain-containing protein [Streptosporangium sp. KLBMP 9127]